MISLDLSVQDASATQFKSLESIGHGPLKSPETRRVTSCCGGRSKPEMMDPIEQNRGMSFRFGDAVMCILSGVLRGARISLLAAAPLISGSVATAQTTSGPSLEEVRAEVAEAMEAIAAYSEAQRESAAAEARTALDQMDAAVAARQREMREAWAEMTETAREDANERLAELQSALVDMAERVGTLQAGADSAWEEVSDGVMSAWLVLSAAVEASLEPPAPSE